MFNRGGFNRLPFNRPVTFDIYGSFELDGTGNLLVLANAVVSPSFNMEGIGELVFDAVREQFGSFLLNGIGELVVEGTRERYGSFIFEGIGELNFTASRYHMDVIEFTGQFKPGDKIVIDSNKLKMTLNDQNALHMMQGDFFDLNTGPNELIYTDDKTGRKIRMRITFEDKFV